MATKKKTATKTVKAKKSKTKPKSAKKRLDVRGAKLLETVRDNLTGAGHIKLDGDSGRKATFEWRRKTFRISSSLVVKEAPVGFLPEHDSDECHELTERFKAAVA